MDQYCAASEFPVLGLKRRWLERLVAPKILEPRRRQFGVPDGVLDVSMAEVRLKRSGIVSLVGERIAAGVPEHVGVGLET